MIYSSATAAVNHCISCVSMSDCLWSAGYAWSIPGDSAVIFGAFMSGLACFVVLGRIHVHCIATFISPSALHPRERVNCKEEIVSSKNIFIIWDYLLAGGWDTCLDFENPCFWVVCCKDLHPHHLIHSVFICWSVWAYQLYISRITCSWDRPSPLVLSTRPRTDVIATPRRLDSTGLHSSYANVHIKIKWVCIIICYMYVHEFLALVIVY